MIEPLDHTQIITRIRTQSGGIAGSGFLISESRLLTCAHVLQKAFSFGINDRHKIILNESAVPFDLPKLFGVQPFDPEMENPYWGTVVTCDWEVDVAVLKLEQPLNLTQNIPKLAVAPNKIRPFWKQSFQAFGFPKGVPNGTMAHGQILDVDGAGLLQLEGTMQQGRRIEHGFSGAPLWNEAMNQIIGMVSQAGLDEVEKVALAIPTRLIAESIPDLATEPIHDVTAKQMARGGTDIEVDSVQGDVVGRDKAERDIYHGKDVNVYHGPVTIIHEGSAEEKPDGVTQPIQLELAKLTFEEALLQHLENLEKEAGSAHYEHYVGLSGEATIRRKRPAAKVRYMHIRVQEEFQQQSAEQIGFDDAIEKIGEIRRAVLLGEPGSGKTTTLLKLAVDLQQCCDRTADNPIPFFARLGRWRDDVSLEQFLQSQAGPLAPFLDELIAQKRVALLLDGVNEVPAELYTEKFSQVAAFAEKHADLLLIVSCRTLDYKELKLNRIEVEPLDPLQIKEYVCNYLGEEEGMKLFWELAAAGAEQQLERFQSWGKEQKLADADGIFWCYKRLPPNCYWGWTWRDEENKDNSYWEQWVVERDHPAVLLNLAKNPYMLYMIVSVFDLTEARTLPKNRGDLFEKFVIHLIGRETVESEDELTQIQGLTDLPSEGQALYQALIDLAWEMQRAATETIEVVGKTLTTMPLSKAERFLTAELGETGPQLARKANLLEIGNEVRFTHQLLQEYFAARALDHRLGELDPTGIWEPENWWEPTNWEETVILLAGLYGTDCSHVIDWLADAQPELTARCLTEGGVRMLPDEKLVRLREKWRPRLTDLKGDSDAQARAALGRALGRLRLTDGTPLDDRRGVRFVLQDGVKVPDIIWGEVVPVGVYGIGGDKDAYNSFDAKDSSTILKRGLARIFPNMLKEGMIEVEIEQDFALAQYPITLGQFECFVQADDVYDPRWWDRLPDEEKNFGAQSFQFTNHPKETVSWYQAIAFCRWLSDKLGYEVGLPHEYEWEVAARWADSKFYPYGNRYDAEKGNTSGSGIRRTSTVGIYPHGKNESLNLYDLSGNVWEWCQNKYDDPKFALVDQSGDTRVVRGGAWLSNHFNARSAYRGSALPTYRGFNFGFRLVRRPHLK